MILYIMLEVIIINELSLDQTMYRDIELRIWHF